MTLEDVRDWVAELGASAEASACWAEAQLHSVAASELLPVLEASHEERAAGFASAEARERERDKARQAARQRALQVSVQAGVKRLRLVNTLTHAAAPGSRARG